MAIVTVKIESTTHRIWKIGVQRQVNATKSYKFIEKLEDDGTGVMKMYMYLEFMDKGVPTEIPLGDSKIPPSVG